MPEELYVQILGSKTPVQLFESLAFNIPLAFTDRQFRFLKPHLF